MSETDIKLQKLKELGKKRQQTPPGERYARVGKFHDGKYESDFVTPFSKSSCNADSEIIVLLQDWASSDKLEQPFNTEFANLGYDPNLEVNKNLIELLQTTFGLKLNDVFSTNVFPFIKPNDMNEDIPQADISEPYRKFCYPQIEIIKPRLVVCCGKKSYIASLKFFSKPTKNLKQVCNSFQERDILFYHQRMPSKLGLMGNRGGMEGAKEDWLRMKNEFEQFKN